MTTNLNRTIFPLDSVGKTIKIGDKVAYNRSGNVMPGIIMEISTVTKYGKLRLNYKIKNLKDNSTSTVVDGMSILVLEK